jgi:hypothetical protein
VSVQKTGSMHTLCTSVPLVTLFPPPLTTTLPLPLSHSPPRLDEAGYEVGSRMLEVLVARERANRRETRLQGVLQFVHTNVWRSLFGRVCVRANSSGR